MTNDGKLNGIDVSFYADCGSSPNEIDVAGAQIWADNGAFCFVFGLTIPPLGIATSFIYDYAFFSLSWSARCQLFLHRH